MSGECALAERLQSESTKSGPVGQNQITKTREDIYQEITKRIGLNRDSQIINYNILINIFIKKINSLKEI